MTAKLFGFNTLAGAARSSTAVVDGDTTAGRFDSAYVGSAIKVPMATAGSYIDSTPFIDGSASVTTLWTRFDWYGATSSNGFTWIDFINSAGVVVLSLVQGAGAFHSLRLDQWNGSSMNTGATTAFSFSSSALRTVAVKCVCGASGTVEVYVGGTLNVSFAVNQASVNNIAKVRLRAIGNVDTFYSQVMGADYDIRSAQLFSKLANAEGTYTTGTGAYTDINEAVLDDSTSISLPAVNDKHSFAKAAITVPSGQQIAAMIVNARGRVGGGTVTDGKILCRSGTTDSASAGKAFVGGYEPRGHAFDNDPNTATRFTQSGFNAAEFGLQAA